jgi:hypothetical protein
MSTYLFSFGRETALTFSFCTFTPGTKCSNQDMGIAWHGMAWHGMAQKSIRCMIKARKKFIKD